MMEIIKTGISIFISCGSSVQMTKAMDAKINELGQKLDFLMEYLSTTWDGSLGASPHVHAGGSGASNHDGSL